MSDYIVNQSLPGQITKLDAKPSANHTLSILSTLLKKVAAKSVARIGILNILRGEKARSPLLRFFCVCLPRYGQPDRLRKGAAPSYAVMPTCSVVHHLPGIKWWTGNLITRTYAMAGTPTPERDLPIQEVSAPTQFDYHDDIDEHLHRVFSLLQVMCQAVKQSNESMHQSLLMASDEVTHARAMIWIGRGGDHAN